MKLSIASVALVGATRSSAFTVPRTNSNSRYTTLRLGMSAALDDDQRPIHDPLGLYPEASPERLDNRIRPLEESSNSISDAATDYSNRPVIDPLNMYVNDKVSVDSHADMSLSLPFVARPQHLDGSMVGDVGFDPLGLAADGDSSSGSGRLDFLREAELKHSRIAMLAAAGWPLAELINTKLAFALHLKPLLLFGDRVPSLLNGGLGAVSPFYWAAVLAVAGGVEVIHEYEKRNRPAEELIFDPLGVYTNKDDESKLNLQLSEIKHGRTAMLAIAAFAAQEASTGVGVLPRLLSEFDFHSVFSSNVEGILSRI